MAASTRIDGQTLDRAAAQNILIWGDVGRVRVSIHLFNDEEDIDTLVDFLATVQS